MILLEKKEECGMCFTDVKIHYKVITIKILWYWHKKGQIDEGTKWRAQKKNSGNKYMLDL